MQYQATYKKHILDFKQAAKTSRNTLKQKPTYLITISDTEKEIIGTGEASTIEGLSRDNEELIEDKISTVCAEINQTQKLNPASDLSLFPAVKFGFETAIRDLQMGGEKIFYETDFTQKRKGIPINGLIWMGDLAFMKEQILEKLENGYNCLKLKIGSHHFNDELALIRQIRKEFTARDIVLRVDANGAFANSEAFEKLKRLADLDIHSIEQPIMAGQWDEMARLCAQTPLPIALDEELISVQEKNQILETIKPQYIILKPSLLGGFEESNEWIKAAEKNSIDWWATSALESNIGLNAIAQWVSTHPIETHQGLGTGQLYTNNIASNLSIEKGYLYFN